MIILLMFPLLERLQGGEAGERRLARLLAETFVTDIDDSLREMGVGDLSVPKKVKRAAQALGERCLAYRTAAETPEPAPALAGELAATLPGLDANPEGASALARYVLAARAALAGTSTDALAGGRITFPDPAATAVS